MIGTRKKDATKKTVAGKPRTKVNNVFRRRLFNFAAVGLLVGLAGGGVWWAWQSGAVLRAYEAAKWQTIALTAKAGFRVGEILVVGRKETDREELLKAVRLARGAPILAFDIDAARQRVEALPWIRTASVERMLPDTLLLRVEERQPMALWQHKGKFALIDVNGEVILRRDLKRFADLVVVVGEGAREHAAELLKILRSEPDLSILVSAAVWVSDRRWNLRMKGGIDVRLPEQNPAAAWTRLAEYEKAHQVLGRDVQLLDLRIPDRLIVRKTPQRPKAALGKGRET